MVPREMLENRNTTYTGRKAKENQRLQSGGMNHMNKQRGNAASNYGNSMRAPSSHKFRSMGGAAGYGKTLNNRYKSQTHGFAQQNQSYSGGIGEAVALAQLNMRDERTVKMS